MAGLLLGLKFNIHCSSRSFLCCCCVSGDLYISEQERLRVRDVTESFFAYYKKMDTSKTFILLFVHQKGQHFSFH